MTDGKEKRKKKGKTRTRWKRIRAHTVQCVHQFLNTDYVHEYFNLGFLETFQPEGSGLLSNCPIFEQDKLLLWLIVFCTTIKSPDIFELMQSLTTRETMHWNSVSRRCFWMEGEPPQKTVVNSVYLVLCSVFPLSPVIHNFCSFWPYWWCRIPSVILSFPFPSGFIPADCCSLIEEISAKLCNLMFWKLKIKSICFKW